MHTNESMKHKNRAKLIYTAKYLPGFESIHLYNIKPYKTGGGFKDIQMETMITKWEISKI